MVGKTDRCFSYSVDAGDCIDAVNTDWLEFARENEATELDEATVVGARLFSFIRDEQTRHLYELLLRHVRENKTTVTVPFRCDAPDLRRFMSLEIALAGNGHVSFTGRIVREESRPPVDLLDRKVARADDVLVICGWCCQVDNSGVWCDVEVAVAELALFERAQLPMISHGLCNGCSQDVLSKMDQKQALDS